MPLDKTLIGRADRLRIDMTDAYQVADRTEKFGVTAEQLKAAVKGAGPVAVDFERNLNMRRS